MSALKERSISLSEILKFRGKSLLEAEIWSVLALGIMAIQDLCLTLDKHLENIAAITPDTLLICQNGAIKIMLPFHSVRIPSVYIAPDIQKVERTSHMSISFHEKLCIYSFGKTLRYASEYILGNNMLEQTQLTVKLHHILNDMHNVDANNRCSLASLFEYVECHAKTQTKGMSFSQYVIKLYNEALENIPKFFFSLEQEIMQYS